MELFILVVNLVAGLWLLAKIGWSFAIARREWQSARSVFTAPFAVLLSPAVWRQLILLAIDLAMTTLVYAFYAITVAGRMSGAISATMAVAISLTLFFAIELPAYYDQD